MLGLETREVETREVEMRARNEGGQNERWKWRGGLKTREVGMRAMKVKMVSGDSTFF